MNEQKNTFTFKQKIFYFITAFAVVFAFCFVSFNIYNDTQHVTQTQNISNLETEKMSVNKKFAQTQHLIEHNIYHSLIGEFGATPPYSVFADTFINFEFNVNEDTLGDYHFSFIHLEKIQLNVIFYSFNHINLESEIIGQIAKTYYDVKNLVGADVDYWFNAVEYYDFHINFTSVDNGISNDADIYFDFYTYDTEDEEIIYTLHDTSQFQYSSPFYVRYTFPIQSSFDIFSWINLFISQEVYDFWYQKGYSDGESVGHEDGYREGFNAASGTTVTDNAFTFIWSTISNATNSVLNVFDRQILPGIPLYVFIMIPVIISVLFFVLKVVKK